MIPLRSVVHRPLQLSSSPVIRPGVFLFLQARRYSFEKPTTWSTRIKFRPDGAPRFTVRTIIIASLITSMLSGLVYLNWLTYNASRIMGMEHLLVSSLADIQSVDVEEYASVDFSSYRASLDYFAHLYAAATTKSPPTMPRDLFESWSALEGTTKEDEAHTILRDVAKEVHTALARIKDDQDLGFLGLYVVVLVAQADEKLSKLSGGADMPEKDVEGEP
ncbi:hypothetical protein K438DRAFT_1832163 [Mycena galopus ATCC 62051]|nr:hypothetical protein K438DRAFT_1832163 [Mycena galopus ATCC 62051]